MKSSLQNIVDEAISKFPLLKLEKGSEHDVLCLCGEIEIVAPNSGKYIDIFEVEVYFLECFPKCFPIVFEIGGEIPRDVKRHVMPKTGNLCLAVKLEEVLLCKHGISVLWFLNNVLVPRLAEEYRVSKGGKYQREYSHDFGGTWEYLMKAFETDNQQVILAIIEALVNNKLPKGDKPCVCDSMERFRDCHQATITQTQHLGKETLVNLFQNLNNNPYKGVNL